MAKSSVLDAADRKALSAKACPSDCPLVIVCRKCDHHDEVIDYLAKHTNAHIKTVRCQKVCEGPVAGLKVDGRMEWFEEMDGKPQLKALACLAAQRPPSKMPKILKKRRSKDRSGCLPR